MENRQKLAVVLVTYNRASDLRVTLTQLSTMQDEFNHLVVINNCSTDNTQGVLDEFRKIFSIGFEPHTLDENRGGAGGFHAGVNHALQLPTDWIWLSDDDAIPQPGCLATLLKHATNEDNLYGSTAVAKGSDVGELCWPVQRLDETGTKPLGIAHNIKDLEASQKVNMLPFLGLMVSKKKALEVGPPNAQYFISGDDMEYCIRMQAAGAKLIQVRDSKVIHPRIPRYMVSFLGWQLPCLRMDPWRRYFDIRNRIWNSRLRSGYSGVLATTSTMLLKLVYTLVHEQNRAGQLSAYLRGIRDGLFDYGKSKSPPAVQAKQP